MHQKTAPDKGPQVPQPHDKSPIPPEGRDKPGADTGTPLHKAPLPPSSGKTGAEKG